MSKSTSQIISGSGQLLIIATEERYPFSSDILMDNGFPIILLNMMFGLLPTTLYGTRLTYFKCSVAQLYAIVFGLCMLIMSGFFIPVVVSEDLIDNNSQIGTAIVVLVKVTHVCGFLLLLARGRHMAKRMPVIWAQLAKLVQLAIVDVHGKKYKPLKELVSFRRCIMAVYITLILIHQVDTLFSKSFKTIPNFLSFYGILSNPLEFMPSRVQLFGISAGLLVWQLCSFSHVLVSALLCFIIIVVKLCLKATNDHLHDFITQDPVKPMAPILIRRKAVAVTRTTAEVQELVEGSEVAFLQKLTKVKNIMVMTENLSSYLSSVWGVSLIIEVLILIANLLVNIFQILIGFQPKFHYDQEGDELGQRTSVEFVTTMENAVSLVNDATIHFYFFYRLCCACSDMMMEAEKPLQILKTIPYDRYDGKVNEAIKDLKSDLGSMKITLTATNYFQINKFLLTSVTSALTTYIIVLIQFSTQEEANKI